MPSIALCGCKRKTIVRRLCSFAVIITASILFGPQSEADTVVGWGAVNWFGLKVPEELTNIVATAGRGERHAIALRNDGTVVGWGSDGHPLPPPGLRDVIGISDYGFSLALKKDGTVVQWPGTAPTSLSNVVAVAAGFSHNLALRRDGTVMAWENNWSGQTNVPAGLSNVVAIAAGYEYSLALKRDGTVVQWPGEAPANLSNVVAVAAGNLHSLALKQDGTVTAWGNSEQGGPFLVPAGLTNVVAIAAGHAYAVALKSDGRAFAWGTPTFGVLDLPYGITNISAISAGNFFGLALTRQPVIAQHPQNQTVLAGTNVTISARVIGSFPWTYQWQKDGVDLAGETNEFVNLTGVVPRDSGKYSLVVKNDYGSTPSFAADLMVNPFPPSIITPPAAQSVLAATNVLFRVAVIGAPPLVYQWQFNGTDIPGATNAALILTEVSELNEGRYQVLAKNAYGTNSSPQVNLTVNYPPAILNPSVNLTVPEGTNWILRVSANGNSPLFYQWQFQGTNIPSATNTSLVLPHIGRFETGPYSVIARNAFGVATNVVYNINITDSPPVIFEQPQAQVFLQGQAVALRVRAFGSEPLRSQWWHNGLAIIGATDTLLMLTNAQPSDVGEYFITISNSFGFTKSSHASLSLGDPFPGQVDWPELGFTRVTTNTVSFPTSVTHAGDGSERLFVVEQIGRVRIIQNEKLLAEPFLEITNRVLMGTERGLLGVAFPPEFATSGRFYVNYTRAPDGATLISRFQRARNANVADPDSEQVLLVIPQPFGNHNGGQLAFGPDRYLYIGMGDGGDISNIGDPNNNAQNPSSLLGKLLRIDVEGGVSPYAAPRSNPFVTRTNYAPEIWALGLRNPWRFSFDRLNGDLFIGDVGHNRYEEIDFQPAGSRGGQNYGWRIQEGPAPYDSPPNIDVSTLTPPVTSYSHPLGYAVIGGYVSRGPGEPRMNGIYFFGDFGSGRIWGLKQVGTNWQRFEVFSPDPRSIDAISTFGEDEQGRIYWTDYYNGFIYQLHDTRQVWKPAFLPASGTIFSNTVNVSSPTPGARIHYTSDGRDPTEFDPSVPSGGVVEVINGATTKIRAFRPDLAPSEVADTMFNFKVGTPAFTPPQGPITNGTPVAITTVTPEATIRFTLDNTEPTTNSPIYIGPLILRGNTTLKARGYKDDYVESAIKSVFYPLVKAAIPVFDPPQGLFTDRLIVSIAGATPNAIIRYTLDGTEPRTSSSVYSAPLTLSSVTTLKARAYRSDLEPSDIQTGFYGILSFEKTVVTTLAGGFTRAPGLSDGLGARARFSSPKGVCIDQAGNLYVADTGNNVIRKILPSGQVTIFAGSGVAGFKDGTTSEAQFSSPTGVCVDAVGNVYVADRNNCHRVRMIGTNGTVTTRAMVQNCGLAPALWQIEADPAGNLYVGSWASVEKVLPNGTVIGIAGTRCNCPGGWRVTVGVGIDAATNIYAATEYRVWKIPQTGPVELFAGSVFGFSDGPRRLSLFTGPLDAAVDTGGNVFVSDLTRVRRIRPDGWVSTLAGAGEVGYVNGPGSQAKFASLTGLCVDGRGCIYVADSGNHCIRKIWIDSDQDGVPDLLEGAGAPLVVGTDDRSIDSDRDGMSNAAERLAGTDPANRESFLAIERVRLLSDGHAEIQWCSVEGVSYVVKYSDDLQSWNLLGERVLGNGSLISVVDSDSVHQVKSRWYRVLCSD